MAILERKLDADAERIAVLRAVAIAAQPLGGGLVEGHLEFRRARLVDAILRLVVHVALGKRFGIELVLGRGEAETGSHAAQRRPLVEVLGSDLVAQDLGIVEHLTRGAELNRPIRIAFARGEGIAECDDEEILDHHVVLGELPAVRQLHRHRHTGIGAIERKGNARDGELALAGELLGLCLSAWPARLPGPDAIAVHAGELLGCDPDLHRMGVRQDVVLFRRSPRISALADRHVATRLAVTVIAGVAQRLCRPA